MIPLKDESGIVGAMHISEYSEDALGSGQRAIGKYLVEFIIDSLEMGSVMGMYGILNEEQWIIQAKCLSKTNVYKISKQALEKFRGDMPYLNKAICQWEEHIETIDPPVDDFYASSQSYENDQRHYIARLWKSGFLKVLKQQREERITNTPLVLKFLTNPQFLTFLTDF